mgnify:CR=1 FL=1
MNVGHARPARCRVAVVLVALFQRSLIYHPTRLRSDALLQQAAADDLEQWRNAAGQRIGWKRLSRTTPPQGQVLVTHGNAGCAAHRAERTGSRS